MKNAIYRQVRRWLAAAALAVWTTALAAAAAPVVPEIAVRFEPPAGVGASAMLVAELSIPEGYHVVRQEGLLGLALADAPAGVKAGQTIFPPATERIAGFDSYSGRVSLRLPVELDSAARAGVRELALRVDWQICSDSGVCQRPESRILVAAVAWPAEMAGNRGGQEPAGLSLPDLAGWLLFALLGGLILNLMPCVLPVLSLKALALAGLRDDPARRRREGLATVAGIMASLLALAAVLAALKAAGAAVGWGFQFQSPWYTLGLAALILALALSLFEVWRLPQFGSRRSGLPARRGGLAAAFASGALTVLLATPCTAPFLGAALGFALAAPTGVLFLVMGAVGVGLALPFALAVFLPRGLPLPKPGPWMDRFRELMALALLATVVWLATVLGRQLDPGRFAGALWFLFLLAAGLRLAGWVQSGAAQPPIRRMLYAVLTAALGLGLWLLVALPAADAASARSGARSAAALPSALPEGWELFDEAAVQRDLEAGRAVFIDFTAAWCLTCQLNEAGALADPAVLADFRAAGVRLYRGDWTNEDPVIARWLAHHGRAGVPFYLLMRPGRQPLVLPELLTADIIRQGLR
jgi:thiol:disulfide interchange protein DsbD